MYTHVQTNGLKTVYRPCPQMTSLVSHNVEGFVYSPNVTHRWFPAFGKPRVTCVTRNAQSAEHLISLPTGVHDFTYSLYMFITQFVLDYGLMTSVCLLVWD